MFIVVSLNCYSIITIDFLLLNFEILDSNGTVSTFLQPEQPMNPFQVTASSCGLWRTLELVK